MRTILKTKLMITVALSKLRNHIDNHPQLIIVSILFLTAINLLNGKNNNAYIYFLVFIINISGYVLLRRSNFQKDKFRLLTDNLLNLAVFLIIFFTAITAITSILLSEFISILGPKYGNIDTWIQFLGSLFGGSLTLVALAFTIKLTQHQNQFLINSSLMPVLTCQNTIFEQHDTICKSLVLKLENVSNNTILNLKIDKLSVFVVDKSDCKSIYIEKGEKDLTPSTNILCPKDSQMFNPKGLSIDQTLRDRDLKYVDIVVDFKYTDIFQSVRYMLRYNVRFILQNNKLNLSYSLSENEHYILKEYIFLHEDNTYQKVDLYEKN